MLNLDRILLLRTRPAIARPGRSWGFTAIELTAVATIIALLALILLPNVRSRVRQARIVTAQDDMRTIEIAESFALADTGFFVRLSDLDNPAPPDLAAVSDLGLSTLPLAQWNNVITGYTDQPTTGAIGTAFARAWNGPYTQFPDTKFITLDDLIAERPAMTRVLVVTGASATLPAGASGPILVIDASAVEASRNEADGTREERTPLDPWGSPYVFFGSGNMNVTNPLDVAFETNFATSVVFTMGPDGIPGDGNDLLADTTDPTNYYRGGILGFKIGQGDDLQRTF